MLLACAIDRFVALPRPLRLTAALGGLLLFLWPPISALIIACRRPDWIAAAVEIERRDHRFAQRLITVASESVAPLNQRGSEQICRRLAEEVEALLTTSPRIRPLPDMKAALPWAICALLAICFVLLAQIPDLGMRQLAVRFFKPWAMLPPVTTTQLLISPGDVQIMQSAPLTIEATARRLGDSSVMLFLNDEGHQWTAVPMSSEGANLWRYTLPAVDRDVRYRVTAGDARSPEFTISTLGRPVIVRFDIRYDYPAYTRLQPAYVSNNDGSIEAPSGTRVLLKISATEPLKDATVILDQQRLPMQRMPDVKSRQVELLIHANQKYSVEMLSARGVRSTGPRASVRCLPDLPPQVRLARGGDSLQMGPHEFVPLSYDALDDFGISSLTVEAQVNSQSPISKPLKIAGDPRRQQDVYNFDLASLSIGIGDVVTLSITATDTSGHVSRGQPVQVLISPRSIDLDRYRRIAELGQAYEHAKSLETQIREAANIQTRLARVGNRRAGEYLALAAQGDRALSNAVQTSALLRQSLLRAIARSESPLSMALAARLDATEVASAGAQEAFRISGTPAGLGADDRMALSTAARDVSRLQAELSIVERGERAESLLIDRTNLPAVSRRKPADANASQQYNETLHRIAEDAAAEARELGIDQAGADLDHRLRELVIAEQGLVSTAKPVDFVTASRDWVRRIQNDPQHRLGMEARLSAAAEAEAIRPGGELIRARNLELASRAAAALAATLRSEDEDPQDVPLSEFVKDVQVLVHVAPAASQARPQTGTAEEIEARNSLARIAGEPLADVQETPIAGRPADFQKEAEVLAMRANAAAAEGNYQQASKLETALLNHLRYKRRRNHPGATTVPAAVASEPARLADRLERHFEGAKRHMDAAIKLDELERRQQQIAETSGPLTADQQRKVADQIASVEQLSRNGRDENASAIRERATAQLLLAQEQLAAMPRVLADIQSLSQLKRESAARAQTARKQLQLAAAEQQEAAERAAAEAQQSADAAANRLAQAARPLAASAIVSLADRLAAFAPETDGVRDLLLSQLVPALQSCEDAVAADDPAALDRAASDTREALVQSQLELAAARDLIIRRNPLLAARWFAQAAAQSLSLQPPDLSGARRHQAGISEFLARAWDQSVHRAAQERLGVLPSLAGILGPPSPSDEGRDGGAHDRLFSAAHQWERLRDQGPQYDPTTPESQPPGYEQSLKLYFEALGKSQEAR